MEPLGKLKWLRGQIGVPWGGWQGGRKKTGALRPLAKFLEKSILWRI